MTYHPGPKTALSADTGISWERAENGRAVGSDNLGEWHDVVRSNVCTECGAHHLMDYTDAWKAQDEADRVAKLGPFVVRGKALTMLDASAIPSNVRQMAERAARQACESLGTIAPALRWFANDDAGEPIYGVAISSPFTICIREDRRGRGLVETVAHECAHSAKPKAEHEDVYAWARNFADNNRDLYEAPPVDAATWRALQAADRDARAQVRASGI